MHIIYHAVSNCNCAPYINMLYIIYNAYGQFIFLRDTALVMAEYYRMRHIAKGTILPVVERCDEAYNLDCKNKDIQHNSG